MSFVMFGFSVPGGSKSVAGKYFKTYTGKRRRIRNTYCDRFNHRSWRVFSP